MNFEWQTLVDALRAELQEYGGIRAILDEQQKAIFARDGDKFLFLSASLNEQIDAAAKLRRNREKVMSDIAAFNELPLGTSLAEMKSVFPDSARPLLKALVDEINAMLNTLSRRSRQNQMLLARTCDIMEKTLQQLKPGNFVKTYSSKGSVAFHMTPIGANIQAVG
jgi:flagellar biosynthesis/type III secretory pathway chaperone